MQYGYFNDLSKEYIITNPKTPVKWINYIGDLNFGGFVDHTGGALICKGDPAINRITKYIPQLPASEFKGETLYVRIKTKDAYTLFSPYFVPTLDQYQMYECHVGLGYMRIVSEFYDIRTEVLIFVPIGGSREIRDIRITNLRAVPVELDAIPAVEYTHFDALKQLVNADWVPQTMQSGCIEEKNGCITLIQYAYMNKDTRVNYFTSNHAASSFETDRKYFLGDNEYSTWECPMSLDNRELGNHKALRGDNMAVLMHHLGVLEPGESRRLVTQLGQCRNVEEDSYNIECFRNTERVDAESAKLKRFWEEYLSKLQVETPDKAMNTMLNIHNPRQCYVTKNWSRYLSLYQLGFGFRGMGFRDSSQDVMGILGNAAEEGRELIEKLLQVQKINGSAMHQFNPVTMIANEGDSRELGDRPDYYSDDHLWIILAVCSYVKETGNTGFLDKQIPFYEKGENAVPKEKGTVLDHLIRAVEFTRSDLGAHGLPLLGFADWNDTVNLPRGAESLFTANLYGKALSEMAELMGYLGNDRLRITYENYYNDMKNSVNNWGWDGEWYIRYFDREGKPVGSTENSTGQIYVNAQSWAVISGFAPENRAVKALDSVNRILNTKNGIKLSSPGYNGYDPEKGGITTYPPGAKENGGIYLHCNPWVMIAETLVGNGDRAYEYYLQINPVSKNSCIDEYECEPYCYSQNILGDEHPQFGLARNSWLSGASSWVYQAAVKYILGIRPTYEGLMVDPCIPSDWKGFKIKKHYRDSVYDIQVRNPEGISKGIKQVMLDGRIFKGDIIPSFGDGKLHSIEVLMGKNSYVSEGD
ncbi:MAG TPA: glycosyl transferase [Clostridia bacterium]|nr:glycosyl transferase [Clostridia bacterium]